MNSDALKTVYKSVVLAKRLYASPAWWSFATSSDKGRIEAQVRRAVRLICIKTQTPLRHNLLRTPMTLFPDTLQPILDMFFTTSCQAELITHTNVDYKSIAFRNVYKAIFRLDCCFCALVRLRFPLMEFSRLNLEEATCLTECVARDYSNF